VIRSLERMRATNYHRLWRNRWEAMISASSIRTHWAPTEEDDSGLWNARLRIDDTIAAVVLGEPPTPASAGRRAGFAMALRAGIPVMIWDRRDRRDDSFETIVNSLIAGNPITLANRVRDLRAQAAIVADAGGNEHIGRHIAVMFDGCGSSGVTLCGEFRVVRGLVSGLPVSVRV
jgi:vWA-MoxR associated protein C-terminal domain